MSRVVWTGKLCDSSGHETEIRIVSLDSDFGDFMAQWKTQGEWVATEDQTAYQIFHQMMVEKAKDGTLKFEAVMEGTIGKDVKARG